MTKWRPKDWKNLYHKKQLSQSPPYQGLEDNPAYNAYESGADAMLKALKKQGSHIYQEGEVVSINVPMHKCKGYLIFIPDEERK